MITAIHKKRTIKDKEIKEDWLEKQKVRKSVALTSPANLCCGCHIRTVHDAVEAHSCVDTSSEIH